MTQRQHAADGRFRPWVSRHQGWLWPALPAIAWLVRYATLYGLPGRSPAFWASWFDQGRYMQSAVAFSHGDLSASAHWYPLGYSLLAAPFVWLSPADPFVWLDLLLFVATAMAFLRAMQVIGIGRPIALVVFVATTLVYPQLARTWVQPWNSTLSAALLWWLIARTAEISSDSDGAPPAPTPRAMVLLGVLAGALPLVRPMDGLLSFLCLAVAALALWRRGQLTGRAMICVAAGLCLPAAPYVALHLAIYGPHPSAYHIALADTGFVFADLGWKAYVLLITPRPWFPDTRSILEAMPWIIPGLAGLIAAPIIARADARRAAMLMLLAAILVSAIPFIAFVDLQPPGLWRFKNIHYFKWMMPLFGIGILMLWRALRGPESRPIAIGVTVCVLLPLGIRIAPVAVAEAQPARMLMFRGDSTRDWNQAYYGVATLTDNIGVQHNVSDYHQMPDAIGVRAIAVRRLFGRDPRRDDPGEPRAFATGARPYARYGQAVSFGLPCWIAPAACALPGDPGGR